MQGLDKMKVLPSSYLSKSIKFNFPWWKSSERERERERERDREGKPWRFDWNFGRQTRRDVRGCSTQRCATDRQGEHLVKWKMSTGQGTSLSANKMRLTHFQLNSNDRLEEELCAGSIASPDDILSAKIKLGKRQIVGMLKPPMIRFVRAYAQPFVWSDQ